MSILHLQPYTIIENRDYPQNTKFLIDKSDFRNIEYQAVKITFSFINCSFKILEIENIENIDFKNISFNFYNCVIDNIKIEKITTINCTFNFGNSIINGKIANANIQSVVCNNCLLDNSIFLLDIKRVSISYTKSNIFPIKWKKLLNKARKKLSYFYNKKQGYHVHKVEEFYYSVDNDVKSLKEKIFNISLSITYSQEVNHIKTKVTKANLTSLSLRGTGLGKITVENSKIDCLYIHDFSSEQGCNLYNIRPFRGKEFERKFEIHESDLDKSWFDNIYFNEYSIISLYRNSYGSTKITSCEFPLVLKEFDKFKTLENIHYPDKIDDNYYRIRYETFLQLKSILGRSDEFYESLRFRAISLNALKEVESLPIWDKIILDINSLSNSHGLSIARPLFWIGIISIIFYILYLMSLGRIFTGGEVDYNLIGYYFSFLDITHRNDFLVSKEDLNSWSMIIDYLNKIVVGFLIFQFVAAFRKYIRK